MSLTPINDYDEQTLELAITFFKSKPNFKKFVEAISESFQELEKVFQDLLTLRSIDTAFGEQLDGIGQIVVLDRNGLNDEDYRAALRFKIFINTSNGEPETVTRALKFFTDATHVEYRAVYPAAYQIFTNGTRIDDNLVPTMQDISPTAIAYIPIIASYGEIAFGFSGDIEFNTLSLDDGGLFWLDDDSPLAIFVDSVNPIKQLDTDGFSELIPNVLALDDGGLLWLDDNSPLALNPGDIDQHEGGGHFCEVLTKDRYKMGELILDDGGLFWLDDEAPLLLTYRKI